ncbi:hypothetical protein HUG17_8761 [Dermatophagoides farinae]|uniref:Uncharacterized protein n=1 Tax=Dermatophagoides farinae TaxID=6954 RepID=A0A9D4SCZ7_DERFA|nr:hypothetical protein HUG17_8761 [Dermatophagoides farinae]
MDKLSTEQSRNSLNHDSDNNNDGDVDVGGSNVHSKLTNNSIDNRHHHHQDNSLDNLNNNNNNDSSHKIMDNVTKIKDSNSKLDACSPDSNLSAFLMKAMTSIVSQSSSSSSTSPSNNNNNSLHHMIAKLLRQFNINSQGINLSNTEEILNLLRKLQQKSATTLKNSSRSPQNVKLMNKQQHQLYNNNNSSRHNLLNSSDGIRQDLDQLSKKIINQQSAESPPPPPTPQQTTDSKSVNNCSQNNQSSSLTSAISSITSSNIAQNKCSLPDLSRFFKLYNVDLINHVSGWCSEQLEKQANSLFEQANHIGNHSCTRILTELKNARSLVRLTEIQKTLQKQRILFASQQIKTVEEWKSKQFANYS